jgi:hypothetical protein
MWRQAAKRLGDARRVVFMGYSMPLTDVTFTNMLRDSIVNSDSEVVIADYSPTPVRDRLTALGSAPERIGAAPAGPGAIQSAIGAWTAALSKAVLLQLPHDLLPQTRMVLAWGDGTAYAPVERLETEDGGVTAIAEAVHPNFNLATGINSRPGRHVSDLRSVIEELGPSPRPYFRASAPGSDLTPVIARQIHSAEPGQGLGDWLVLQVAGTPPDTQFL